MAETCLISSPSPQKKPLRNKHRFLHLNYRSWAGQHSSPGPRGKVKHLEDSSMSLCHTLTVPQQMRYKFAVVFSNHEKKRIPHIRKCTKLPKTWGLCNINTMWKKHQLLFPLPQGLSSFFFLSLALRTELLKNVINAVWCSGSWLWRKQTVSDWGCTFHGSLENS